jgi:hypothetical protein
MTQKTDADSPSAVSPAQTPQTSGGKRMSIDELVACFQTVSDDIVQIGKLTSEEHVTATQFFASLSKYMQPLAASIAVSTSLLPIEFGIASQAHILPTGQLQLTYDDGSQRLVDLSGTENRDLLMKVIDDVMPKFEALIRDAAGKLRRPAPLKVEAPASPVLQPPPASPAPLPPAAVVEPPVTLPEPVPVIEAPAEPPHVPTPLEMITAETLNYLDMLGGEVFEQAPVSKYFDDWMVNLRQVILSFESNDAIGPDEAFSAEYNRIFGDIEEELANRQATEADMAVSARTLVERRYLLNQIDEGYAAQTKELVVKGKSSIDNLMASIQNIEKELAEVQQIKTSFRHPLQKMAKDQKIAELTQKLNATKKRLAVTVGTASVDKGKTGDIDAEYAAHTRELEEKRKIALTVLLKNVRELEKELNATYEFKTLNPIKRLANEQKQAELTVKLEEAKKSLEVAKQSSSAEIEKLRSEYERKKQEALGTVKTLEKDLATKAVDSSAGVRREAAKALAEAVKARAQRKTEPPQPAASEESKPQMPPMSP